MEIIMIYQIWMTGLMVGCIEERLNIVFKILNIILPNRLWDYVSLEWVLQGNHFNSFIVRSPYEWTPLTGWVMQWPLQPQDGTVELNQSLLHHAASPLGCGHESYWLIYVKCWLFIHWTFFYYWLRTRFHFKPVLMTFVSALIIYFLLRSIK